MKGAHLADRIIVALDVPDETVALQWVERLPEVRWWKVGLELFTAAGPRMLTYLKQRHKSIFFGPEIPRHPPNGGPCMPSGGRLWG